MSAFDTLRRFLRSDDVTVALPADPFIVIDRQRTAEKLRLDERAQENGSANFPKPDAEDFDDVEQDIVAEIVEQARRAQIDAATNHRIYSERLSELALLRELSTITSESHRALGDYRATVISRRGQLAGARDAIQESHQELATFKKDNSLSRPAHNRLLPIYAWSTFALSWFGESALNTFFLRVNDPFGILGGFIAAAVIAAINVGLSAVVGRTVWPNLSHKNNARSWAARAGFVVWVLFLVVWNLAAAHFRDAKGEGRPNPERVALDLFLSGPLQLDSIYSYGLLVAGFIFAGIAAVTAYKMDDPYPGYGEMHRRHVDRCDEYSAAIQEAFDELKTTRDGHVDSASAIRDELQLQFRERGQIIAARESHRNRYREHQDYLESVGKSLLAHYRSANLRHRTDGQTPAGFRKQWHLNRNELPRDGDEPSIEGEVTRAESELKKAIDTINSAYIGAIESFDHLDTLKRSLENA
jgi:hypothetical protein